MILIVARTHQEAVTWCRENEINPRDPNYRIAVRRQDFEGLRPEKTKIVSFPAGVSASDIARLTLAPKPQQEEEPKPRWEDAGTRTILQWPWYRHDDPGLTYATEHSELRWRGFFRQVPRKAYYTVDGGRLCPCKGMTDEDLDDYEHLFKVGLIQPRKTDWGGVLVLLILAALCAVAVFDR